MYKQMDPWVEGYEINHKVELKLIFLEENTCQWCKFYSR